MKDLVGVAFFDTSVYITSVNVIKHYILYGDVYKSIGLLRWRDDTRQLTMLAKDYQSVNVYSTHYLISQQNINFVAADGGKNIQLFAHAPQNPESRGGQRLVCVADFHLGAHIERMNQIRVQVPSKGQNPKNALVFGTLDGGIGCLELVDELVFKRLLTLQQRMVNALPHFAGLNPRGFRGLKTHRKLLRNLHSNVLDGDLLYQYPALDLADQRRLARQIGTTPEQIFDNLLELKQAKDFF